MDKVFLVAVVVLITILGIVLYACREDKTQGIAAWTGGGIKAIIKGCSETASSLFKECEH